MAATDLTVELSHALRPRHLTMISIGGIIGAGLFVGSSAAIAATGPAVVLSYLLTGILILLVMRMIGEMAVAHPGQRAFTEFARIGLGRWAGFVTRAGSTGTSGWSSCRSKRSPAQPSSRPGGAAASLWEIGLALMAGDDRRQSHVRALLR